MDIEHVLYFSIFFNMLAIVLMFITLIYNSKNAESLNKISNNLGLLKNYYDVLGRYNMVVELAANGDINGINGMREAAKNLNKAKQKLEEDCI